MAEEIADIIDEASQGIEDEAADTEGLSEEEVTELQEEAAAAQEATTQLGNVVEGLKKLGDLTLAFTKFVMQNAAIGAIFYGVTIALKKLTARSSGADAAAAQQKYEKIKAISGFITSSSDMSHEVSDWLHDHKDEYITLDGIDVPLISIFVKYTGPLEDAADAELKVAQELMQKTADGKTTFLTPDAGQVSRIIDNGQKLVDALRDFQAFAAEKSDEFPVLKTLPMTKEDVDSLQQKLDAIKNMPF